MRPKPKPKKTPTEQCFYFWNHCFAGRYYPTRPTQKDPRTMPMHPCERCGKDTPYAHLCYACLREENNGALKIALQENRVRRYEAADEFTDLLKTCSVRGTCDVLAAHHKILENDPERLTTEFLVKQICGKTYVPGSKTREVLDYTPGRGRPRKTPPI